MMCNVVRFYLNTASKSVGSGFIGNGRVVAPFCLSNEAVSSHGDPVYVDCCYYSYITYLISTDGQIKQTRHLADFQTKVLLPKGPWVHANPRTHIFHNGP